MMPAPLLKFATGVAALQLAAGASLRSHDGERARITKQRADEANPLKKKLGVC